MNIKYYADNDTMGDTYFEDCNAFRRWAAAQLRTEYPDHIIQVINGPSLEQFQTDDEENREEIADFCARLWDRCPWPL
jgi:glutathione peroxidase-family protein